MNLHQAIAELAAARTVAEVIETVRRTARALIHADGVTFVLRDGDHCYYAEEDAIAPLWKGKRFPLPSCISGWSMLNRQTVVISDVYADPRIPHDAYRSTFVKSLLMVPVRWEDPVAAIGGYWAREHVATPEQQQVLEALANAAALALRNVELNAGLQRSIEAQRVNEERLRLATAGAKIGAFDLDLRTGKNVWTPELEAMYGLASEEFAGSQPAWERLIHPEDRAGALAAVEKALDTGEPLEHEWRVVWRDGTERWIAGRFQAFKDEAGIPIRLAGVNIDVTQRKRTELALAEREEQLRLATQAAEVGLWDVDMITDTLFWPPIVKAMFGISADAPVSMADFYSGLHPEDRESTTQAFAAALDPIGRALYDVEYRTVGKEDGVIRWVAAKGRGFFDASGRCVRVIGTAIDITARKRAQAALEQASRQKDEFLAMLAHELRNPLAPIRNVGEFLQRIAGDDQRFKTSLEVLTRQTTQLTRLVDDLLDVSRIAQGRITLVRAPHEIADLIDQATETVQPLLTAKSHDLQIVRPAQPLYVNGDAARLVQVLGNVLHNAIKYTDPGGQLRCEVHATDEFVELQIRDNGCGMSPSLLPHAFDLFVQSTRTLDRAQGGLGVGLNVVKRLVEMHGGEVKAESPGEGRGTTVTIRLPRVSAQPASDVASLEQPAARRRILIVDDNADAADTLALLLQTAGHEVAVAYSASAVLEKVEELAPDVILLDVGLPGMDGYEVARRLRQINSLKEIRIIALTGYGQAHDREQALAAGFDAHLVKPANRDVLLRLLAEARPRQVVLRIAAAVEPDRVVQIVENVPHASPKTGSQSVQ